MEPWSVGKYAKRTATLHLGSEDQTSTSHSTLKYKNVLVLNYTRAAAAPRTLYMLNPTTFEQPTRGGEVLGDIVGGHSYIEVKGFGTTRGQAGAGNNADLDTQMSIAGLGAVRANYRGLNIQSLPHADSLARNILTARPKHGADEAENELDFEFTDADGVAHEASKIAFEDVQDLAQVQVGDVLAVGAPGTTYGAQLTIGNYEFAVIVEVVNDAAAGGAGGNPADRHVVVRPKLQRATLATLGGGNAHITRNALVDIRERGLAGTDTHVDYGLTVPNIIGYPEHKRCLIQVQEAWF
eukprot:COSAG01_NODE_7284_length_3271_cov_65.572194_1_plen_295_part_10